MRTFSGAAPRRRGGSARAVAPLGGDDRRLRDRLGLGVQARYRSRVASSDARTAGVSPPSAAELEQERPRRRRRSRARARARRARPSPRGCGGASGRRTRSRRGSAPRRPRPAAPSRSARRRAAHLARASPRAAPRSARTRASPSRVTRSVSRITLIHALARLASLCQSPYERFALAITSAGWRSIVIVAVPAPSSAAHLGPERQEPDRPRVLDDDVGAVAQLAAQPVAELVAHGRAGAGVVGPLPGRGPRVVDRHAPAAHQLVVEVDDPARLAEPARVRVVGLDLGLRAGGSPSGPSSPAIRLVPLRPTPTTRRS